jgi:hypothetical protein
MNDRNGHGPLWQPGQMQLAAAHVRPDGVDFASSVGVVAQSPGGGPTQVFAVGGFTQLEALAVALAPLALEMQIDDDEGFEPLTAIHAGERAAQWANDILHGIKMELAK